MHHIFKREWLVAVQQARPHAFLAEHELGSRDVSTLGDRRPLDVRAIEGYVNSAIT